MPLCRRSTHIFAIQAFTPYHPARMFLMYTIGILYLCMKKLFNKNFFTFLFSFVIIIIVSLFVLQIVGSQATS